MAHQQMQRTAGHPPQRNALNRLFVPAPPPPMSRWSTAAVPDGVWADQNFLLGAGMVVIQPETRKVVVLYESRKKYWFLPKGRKDVGESLEQTALREAYEESGYRVEPLPLYTNTCAPGPAHHPRAPWSPSCEPIMIITTAYPERKRRGNVLPPGEYLSFWYVGQIPEDAVREEGTGMPDEANYEAHLLSIDDALRRIGPAHAEARVVEYAWTLFNETVEMLAKEREQQTREQQMQGSPSDADAAESAPAASTSPRDPPQSNGT